MTTAVIAAMLAVIAGFLMLAATSLQRAPEAVRRLRTPAVAAWVVIVVAGWLGVAYLAFRTAGGLDAASAWTQAQPPAFRIAMWLFLLPWMGALAIWRTGWAEGLRVTVIVGLALLTLGLSIRQK